MSGTVALVTGASRGIGRAVVARIAAAGVDVVLNYAAHADGPHPKAAEEALTAARHQGVRAIAVEADVSDRDAVSQMVAEAEAELGTIDLLVNNAGITSVNSPLATISEDDWDRILDVNLKGMFLVTQAVVPGMRKRGAGKIVNIASELALIGKAEKAAYCASKAGVIGLTKALARELAPDGILVNCIAPGPTDTDMLHFGEATPGLAANLPLGRLGTPEEVAEAIWFLLSPATTWTTGQVLSPNGGAVI